MGRADGLALAKDAAKASLTAAAETTVAPAPAGTGDVVATAAACNVGTRAQYVFPENEKRSGWCRDDEDDGDGCRDCDDEDDGASGEAARLTVIFTSAAR